MTEVTEACRSLDQIVFDEVSVEAMQKINCQNVLKRKENNFQNVHQSGVVRGHAYLSEVPEHGMFKQNYNSS